MNVQNYYYSNINNNKSETHRKLESLCLDVTKSWRLDCDETNSMKEISEIIDGMLLMSSLEEYFSNNKADLEYFMGDFTKDVISHILMQPVIYGKNGDDIALDLLFHFIKLYMHFHKNKDYSVLFDNVRKIFSKESHNPYFVTPDMGYKKEINPKKGNTYEEYNEEFCKFFKKEKINNEKFKLGDKVDVLVDYMRHRSSLDKKVWVRGFISEILEKEYIIEYPSKFSYDNKVNYSFDDPNVLKEGTKTEDWEWRLSLQENDVIDCYDRGRWYPATICKVNEYKNDNGFIYKEYKVGFRLYSDNFLDNGKYDYNTFLQCTIFWDNNDNVDREGKSFYGDGEGADEDIAFYSKRIQKFQTFTPIQRDVLNNQMNKLMNSYNNSPRFGSGNTIQYLPSNNSDCEDRIKIMTELLEKDNIEKNIDDLYLFEKDNKTNYIIGKDTEIFSYYFAKLLKLMADNGYFEEMLKILKDKPTPDEIYNIFYILMNCTSFIHKEYFKKNYELFKNAFFDMMDNLSSKEMRSMQKEVNELCNNFFIKINYILSENKTMKAENMNDINLTLSLKMIKSSKFDKVIQGLKSIGDYIKTISDDNSKTNLINLLKKYNIIKDIFGTNYHAQIISKSNEILEFMIKNDELTEDELKLIWSLTRKGDVETEKAIIQLLSDLINNFNEKYCNILLEYLDEENDKNLNENKIDLIYNLAIKANNEKYLIKCCELYCNNIFEIKNINNLSKSAYKGKILHLISKGENLCKTIINIFEKNIKENNNILAFFFLFEKIIEKYKKNITTNSGNNDFINKHIHSLIDNDRLLNFFKDNFLTYKKTAKETLKNNSNINIDGYTHEENMNSRISFLIKSIPILYPKFDFFELLKEICLHDPVLPTDKSIFYKFMQKYLSEINSNNDANDFKEQKISIETQLFNMLTEENKTEMTLDQYNLYIKIFLDINYEKDILRYDRVADLYNFINIKENINIEDIFGIDKLWDLYFEYKKQDISKKLIDLFLTLYKNKNETKKLLDKCVSIIKDNKNLTANKLEKCISLLIYIILDSEKKGYIQVKSHFKLLKNLLINIPLDLQKHNKNNNDINKYLFHNKSNDNDKYNSIDILYGNTTIYELRQILSEKYNLDAKHIYMNFGPKENNSKNSNNSNNNVLDSTSDNKTLMEMLTNEVNNEKTKLVNKFSFTGDIIEKESFTMFGHINPKYKKMIEEWFYKFSNGNEILEKENIIKFISYITGNKNVDEKNEDYIKFMLICDKDNKDFILEDEFTNYYIDLAKSEPKIVRNHIKKMKYRDDFKKSEDISEVEIIDKYTLPRYILGNDREFFEALIQLFSKFENKMNIYNFLFLLCTNEIEYNDLLENFQKFFNENSNYLQQLYHIFIFSNILEDLEIKYLDLKNIFMNNNNKKNGNNEEPNCEIVSKEYLPFDDKNNLDKKKLFLFNFIENKGYENLIKYIENLFDSMTNNKDEEEEKIIYECCKYSLNIMNMIYNSLKENYTLKQKNSKLDIFYLFHIYNNINIKKMLDINDNKNDIANENENNNKNNKFNQLKEIVLNAPYINLIKKIISFLTKSPNKNKILSQYCFDTLVNLMTHNEKLSLDIQNNNEIKQNISDLIKSNINSSSNKDENKFFIQSLITLMNNISKNNIFLDKYYYDFLYFIFEISNSLFKELMNKNNNENNNNKENNYNYAIFFDFFSNLIKVILNPDNINNMNINKNINNEFIFQIYELLYKDLKEENKSNKLNEDTFLGFIKILMTTIKSDQLLKNKILLYKINDETLFDIIYNIVLNEKINKNSTKKNKDDDLDIENLISNADDNTKFNKFIPIDKCDELRDIFNNLNQNKDEQFITQKIFDIFHDFILICLNGSTEPEYISKLLKIISLQSNRNYSNKTKKNKVKKPKSYGYVGLKNIGCICYMNSILQQMYMVPSFRYAIISSDDKKSQNIQTSFFGNNMYDDNLLHQLQKMYTFLNYSEKEAYNPKDFCASFKDFDNAPINPLIQQDSQEFFNNFCDEIENCLKNTKYKYIVDNIFTGKTCSSVICQKCKTVSNRFEDFYNLTLEVKNIGNLYESLDKLIDPEKIEQFKCEVCKQNVTITKRTSLAKLPNVLFVHLKRFYMDYELERTEKINSKFEFPNTLDLKKFCIEEISKKDNETSYDKDEIYPKEDEYYKYELKGINIHMGNAQGGHYISFIDVERDGHNNDQDIKASIENNIIKSKWLKFNDSIVCQFDTKDIPVESYGGYIDNTLSNENIQSAYLLIYERIKKTPIKIILDKESIDQSNKDNNLISFKNEQKLNIEKFYDISYSNKEKRVKEDELYNLKFYNEETDEYYSYIPYYNIEKNVLKDNFIEVMNKNKKFFNNKIILEENSKFKDECNDILFTTIHSKNFNIINNNFSFNDKTNLITFFQEQIFNNKIFRTNSLIEDDENKIILNDRANILLENLIIPLLSNENQENSDEYEILINLISNIILSSINLDKIFEVRSIYRVFDIKNVKLFSEIIYSILVYYNKNKDIQKYFLRIYKLIEDMSDMGNTVFYANEENEKKEKISPAQCLYNLLYELLKLNSNFIEFLIKQEKLSILLFKINNTKISDVRKNIYDILTLLIDNCNFYPDNEEKDEDKDSSKINLDNDEKEKIKEKIFNSKKLLKRLFNEKIELLIRILKMALYNDGNNTEKFNQFIFGYLFNYAMNERKVKLLMDLLYEIINIKDKYILNRLYFIMGFPEMIIKHQIEEEQNENEYENPLEIDSDDDDDDEQKQRIVIKKKKKEEENNESKQFLPLFGYKLLEQSQNGEIFKYVNNVKLFETHCILAQLFPCTNKELYANQKFIEGDENLDEKERKIYIYKLLCLALLDEGNYCLFKYIYLTPSRFIIKYPNLYEEIIDILKNENKYDLTEIIKNAENCIKRVNFEINRINDTISLISKKKIDVDDEDEKENKAQENKTEEENNPDFSQTPPDLPEKMMKVYKENEDIEEFTGFIPRHIPDSIKKVVYTPIQQKQKMILLCVKYYTSFKNVESLRNKEEKKIEKKVEEKNPENKIIEKEKQEENNIDDNQDKLNDNEDDLSQIELSMNENSDEIGEDNEIIANKIKISESLFLQKIIANLIQSRNKIKLRNVLHDNKPVKLSLIRFVLVSLSPYKTILRTKINENNINLLIKHNFYAPGFSMGCIRSFKYTDVLIIYRKNKILDFMNENSLQFDFNFKQKQCLKNDSYFDEWSDSD